jgi:2-polyprenyl-3-methyl-5-hydroxy-6-metoxy-1,4-benzoquinol methylase
MIQRDRQPELMDDPGLPEELHHSALVGLARLNRFSGIANAMYRRLRRYVPSGQTRIRVLDVASGAGDIPISCARRARAEGLTCELTMMDISEVAADEQLRRSRNAGVPVDCVVQDCLRQPLPGGFDVITCSLFLHHLDDRDSIRLLQSMQAATPRAILISDLDRSMFNLGLVTLASRVLTRSSVVHTDAALSVRAAYTRHEFKTVAEKALLRPIYVEPSFPCRYFAVIDDETVPIAVPAFA